jgi:hypothetical protein
MVITPDTLFRQQSLRSPGSTLGLNSDFLSGRLQSDYVP